ncbi:MAG: hypothetical protein CL867_01185 [Cytophagaceae bacterium]|nr:hypothetical protein [Cytophagaceae bacterium]
MQSTTLFLLIGAAILALGMALFQYYYKTRFITSRNKWYAVLRFLTIFALLVLLINPSYTKVTYYSEKPSLAIAIDNSASVAHLDAAGQSGSIYTRFRESEPLNKTFDISYFSFGSTLTPLDSLTYTASQTDISSSLRTLQDIYKDDTAPTIFVTDGNQTYGEAYQYTARNYQHPVYAVVVGDTIVYDDLKISQVNVNKYAYINNKFPVEIFATYNGRQSVSSRLIVKEGNTTVHSQSVQFDPEKRSEIINVLLPATSVGVRQYKITLNPVTNEQNTTNNSRNFAVEVIDQKTNIAIVSDLVHPDLGSLKKSIESNRLRKATFLSPQQAFGQLNEYQLVILYQPTANFKSVYDEIEELNKNTITISGPNTDWRFLNQNQSIVRKEITRQSEEVQPIYNRNFSSFIIEEIGFDDLPPLETSFGELQLLEKVDIALYQRIGQLETEDPLLITSDNNGRRAIYIFGSGLWRWRAGSYLEARSFEKYDNFVDKLIQYAASNKRKSRLNIDYESFYYGNNQVLLYAQYFDKNYVFDPRAAINIEATHKESGQVYQAPFLLQKTAYQIDLGNLSPGEYTFSVTVKDQGLTRTGQFTIVPFAVEKQFLNADMDRLRAMTDATDGAVVMPQQLSNFIDTLVNDKRYRPVQKQNKNTVPLIDWKWLLAFVIILLSVEWFMRKYNGLT